MPLAVNSWQKSYTVIARMRQGKQVIVPGDGTSLWTITHNSDFAKGFVGLLGHPQAIGARLPHHLGRSDDLGPDLPHRWPPPPASRPTIVHMPSDFIAACVPDRLGSLHRATRRQRRVRQQQDQAVRARLLRDHAVPNRASGERWRGLTPIPRAGKSTTTRMPSGTN